MDSERDIASKTFASLKKRKRPRMPKIRPRPLPDGSNSLQKSARNSKTHLKRLEDHPRRLQDAPRRLQDTPRRLQAISKMIPDIPTRIQVACKSAQISIPCGLQGVL